ncbi:MAG: DUF21 domain-containing protein [Phycisphaerales bacterium]|nr:DUF21 domain-containing protein [Phycisphaerales bacterium]
MSPEAEVAGIAEIAVGIAMIPMIAGIAFFAAVETALFGLTAADRVTMKRTRPHAAALVERLRRRPRALLLSTMLGAILCSSAYFVASTVLFTRVGGSPLGKIALAVVSIFGCVVAGELIPKALAMLDRVRLAALLVYPAVAFDSIVAPVRNMLDQLLIMPLTRLLGRATEAPQLTREELAALLDLSARSGSIDATEQGVLEGVVRLRRLRVRDVMTPRVDMASLGLDATEQEVLEAAGSFRLTHFPIVGTDVDDVRGLLAVKQWLLAQPRRSIADSLEEVQFIPELASLELLLEHFRKTATKLAIVVDEYGGTAGVVAVEDCVEEIIGDIIGSGERAITIPEELPDGRWRVSGEMSAHRWSEVFGLQHRSGRTSTVAGLVLERLTRLPRVGDRVQLGNVSLEVELMDGARVESVLVSQEGAE